ncbi:Disease resistance protein rpp13 [Thalictrum thalictroides]|uniref:Disease resistance protein rpp13 n=1 Tax=Thalictrum thalictroides TaxID=46969 RepID=A0A7J6WZD8_THATH|nr:Disease resistance protein rpp13 [Thalictrum thalictroides]
MAESIVSSFVDKLSFLISEEANFLLGVEGKLIYLRDELEWIRHFLKDAEKKRRKFQLVEVWVTQIRDLAFEAEDVIDSYMLHVEQRKNLKFTNKIIYSWKKLKTLHRIGNQIEQINTRAERISACKSKYNLDVSELVKELHPRISEDMESRRKQILTAEEFDVVGFQKESAQVANWLKDEVHQRLIISIIGMGGLGKTTLARIIFTNIDISSQFDARAWISVTQVYQVRDLLLSISKQVIDEDYHSLLEKMDTTELKEQLLEKLENKRYLLIIDDIWNVEAWKAIYKAFPDNEKGSRVVLTTRNKEVAVNADPLSRNHVELRLLNEDESWELFGKKVFSGRSCPLELVKLGKEIVNKCGGLPLGIVVIGGLLMGKERTPSAWSKVLDSATWQLSQHSNQCMWKSTFGDGKTMLRVLDLEGIKIGKAGLPNEIGKLIFLQYLGLYSTGLQTLPTSIGSLLKLQTLDIRSTFVRSFPRALWKMKNLRHLFLSRRCNKIEKGNTVAIKEFGRDLLTLHASGGMWMTADGGLSEVLVKQRCLRSLEVFGKIIPHKHKIDKAYCFPSSLTELCLYFSGFQIDPSDALGSLPNLKTLSLYYKSYMGKEMNFKSGGFPQLHVLNLVDLKGLTEWRVADGAIPSLRHLFISRCPNLQKLPGGLRNITTLQYMMLEGMSYPLIGRVEEDGEDWGNIKHIPFLTIQEIDPETMLQRLNTYDSSIWYDDKS